MCGIAAILNIRKQTPELREKALAMARRFVIVVPTGVEFIVEDWLS